MAILRQKEARSRDYDLLLFRVTSRVLYSAQYHRQHCDIFKIISYADDSTLLAKLSDFNNRDNKENINVLLNRELEKNCVWLKVNRLSLNTSKSKFMLFYQRQKRVTIPNIKINSTDLRCIDNFNFLGLTFNKHLGWADHVNKLSNKICKIIGIMNKIKFQLPQNILLTIYNSLILSQLNYCLLGWGYESKHLYKLQKRAIRIIDKSPKFSHADPLFKKLKILKIHDILHLNQLKFYNKLLNNQLPEYFDSFNMPRNCTYHNYNTRHCQNLRPFRPKREFCKRCLRYNLPKIINTTSTNIINKIFTHSFDSFCRYIKLSLLENYTENCMVENCYVCHRLAAQ